MFIFAVTKMKQKGDFVPILFLIQFMLSVTTPLVHGSDGLTRSELRENYGQGKANRNWILRLLRLIFFRQMEQLLMMERAVIVNVMGKLKTAIMSSTFKCTTQ